ncbi:NDP-hexose 2,3-dehydratase family protein [Saccharopolyspora sp. 5N708]|uniref:NDP-hexose 2,3-dehydratase family protein n=1 Tax=Saccharopolyspora sp. 5N708 TaxID=3457424 RepID=UPI003FCFB9E5
MRMSPSAGLLVRPAERLAGRLAVSSLVRDAGVLADFHQWLADLSTRSYTEVEPIALDELDGWSTEPRTGNIVHASGRFFVVEGLDVHIPGGPVPRWRQPIINQPEVGVLGILAKEFDGVLHFLMQAKVEPGNCNGLQLSPTVQATRSNYTGAHRGRSVPYLDFFLDTGAHTVIADVRQSEQGAWFHQKRNRNMVVEVHGEVPLRDGFRWFTLGQLNQLLAADDLVNMDARTVLSCLPFAGPDVRRVISAGDDWFRDALLRSCVAAEGSVHSDEDIRSWITSARTSTDVHTRRIPLVEVHGWHRADGRIRHESGLFFEVMGVRVRARSREVDQWTQPMIEASGPGVVAFVVRRIGGVLHVLVHGRVEPGYVDVIELAPTVQCKPENYRALPAAARPPFLDYVMTAAPERIRFDAVLSEEGGRFFRTRNRYLIVEAAPDEALAHPEFRWVTADQLVGLLRHSHYLNVQARSLVACLHSLLCAPAGRRGEGTP